MSERCGRRNGHETDHGRTAHWHGLRSRMRGDSSKQPLVRSTSENPPTMMKTLFLNPPSYEGFDGGAGSRYQAKREIRSFWYPTWLAQVAALVKDSKLIDAPPRGL